MQDPRKTPLIEAAAWLGLALLVAPEVVVELAGELALAHIFRLAMTRRR